MPFNMLPKTPPQNPQRRTVWSMQPQVSIRRREQMSSPETTLTKTELQEIFDLLTRERLIEVAVNLSLDCARLRDELDRANGVIR